MADTNVLEEFLVSVVYDVNEKKREEFVGGLVEAQVKAKLLGDALEAMALRAVAAIERYTTGMERLYYVSRNTGASVQNLQALGFAASQFGSSADEAAGAVGSLNEKMKSSPGFSTMLNSLGIATQGRDRVDILRDTIKYLATLPDYMRKAREEQLGISENLYQSLKNNDQIQQQMDRFTARQRRMGLNPQKAAADAAEFMRSWRDLGSVLDNIGSLIESRFLRELAPKFTQFTDYLALHGDDIARIVIAILSAIGDLIIKTVEFLPKLDEWVKAFGGWQVVLGAVAAALLLLYGRMVLLGALVLPPWLLAMLGVGAGAAYAEGQLRKGPDAAFDAVTGGATEEQQNNRNMGVWDRMKRVWRSATGQQQDIIPGKSGTVSGNQKEAYAAARADGLSDKAAKALVANMTGEGLAVPHNVHWDGSHYAHGIVQWDDVRSARIKAQFGKMPNEMSVAEQTKAALWEMKKFYPRTYEALQGDNSGAMIHSLVHDYERPADKEGQTAARSRIYAGLGSLGKDGIPGAPGVGGAGGPAGVRAAEAAGGYVPKHDGSPGSVPVPPIRVPGGVMVDGKLQPSSMGSGIGAARALNLSPITTNNSPSVENHFNINGAMSPKETAAAVHEKQASASADMVRNMRNAVG